MCLLWRSSVTEGPLFLLEVVFPPPGIPGVCAVCRARICVVLRLQVGVLRFSKRRWLVVYYGQDRASPFLNSRSEMTRNWHHRRCAVSYFFRKV
jgi:hypothetical protein